MSSDQDQSCGEPMKVDLEPYTPAWKETFRRHQAIIGKALGHLQPVIDHIGSTSLGSIAAKPIIDILVGLKDGQQLDDTVAPMIDAGYCYIEQFNAGMPYRRFYAKLVPLSDVPLPIILHSGDRLAFGRNYNSIVNIHVMAHGTSHWVRHIAFRDYLLAHPEEREAYHALKLAIATIEFDDPLDYNAHKEAFIAEHQRRAIDWFLGQPGNEGLRVSLGTGETFSRDA